MGDYGIPLVALCGIGTFIAIMVARIAGCMEEILKEFRAHRAKEDTKP